MNPTQLGTLLRDAAAGIEPPPDFAEGVVRGARRRRIRRLTTAAGAVAVVALAVAGTVIATQVDRPATPVADPLLTQPTKGDLAGDEQFRETTLDVWHRDAFPATRRDYPPPDERPTTLSDPHVYWAGNTPAGQAAVVMQQVRLPETEPRGLGGDSVQTVQGIVAVDPVDGQLRLVAEQRFDDTRWQAGLAVRFGDGDRTVLVVDGGVPIYYSPGIVLREHRVERDWTRAPVRDGVALVQLPPDVDVSNAMFVEQRTTPPPDFASRSLTLPVASASVYVEVWKNQGLADNRLPPPNGLRWESQFMTVGDPVDEDAARDRYQREVTYKVLAGDRGSYAGRWSVTAGLADGTVVITSEIQNDALPARLYTLVIRPDDAVEVYDGGAVDPGATLPVRFGVPEGRGWVVADHGHALAYRTSPGGAWVAAGEDAALLPGDATEVKVDGTVVPLT